VVLVQIDVLLHEISRLHESHGEPSIVRRRQEWFRDAALPVHDQGQHTAHKDVEAVKERAFTEVLGEDGLRIVTISFQAICRTVQNVGIATEYLDQGLEFPVRCGSLEKAQQPVLVNQLRPVLLQHFV
jgi:hypothetical protein